MNTCAHCNAEIDLDKTPTMRNSGDFVQCRNCGHDIHTGESFESWAGDKCTSRSEEGQKFDTDKTQWDLTPWLAQTEVAEVLTYGANKYSRDNWRHVPNAKRRYTAALFRHVVAWLRGEKCDPESGKHHLAHAACCILFMLETELES